jgi:tight adherence protein B
VSALTLILLSLLAAGLVLILLGFVPDGRPPARRWTYPRRVTDWLAQADLDAPVRTLVLGGAGLGVAATLLVTAVTGAFWVACWFGALAAQAPLFAVQARRRRRLRELRSAWPDAIDQLVSGVRAGLSVGEALTALADRGPAVLRPPVVRFARAYRATGRMDAALDQLGEDLADPTADRVVASLRIAHEVGGSEIGRILQTLAASLRDEQRVRLELEARQTWVVTAARVAFAMPFLVLALLVSRPEAMRAYGTPTGALVVAAGALAALTGYRLMLLIGRLPTESRVLTTPRPTRSPLPQRPRTLR